MTGIAPVTGILSASYYTPAYRKAQFITIKYEKTSQKPVAAHSDILTIKKDRQVPVLFEELSYEKIKKRELCKPNE